MGAPKWPPKPPNVRSAPAKAVALLYPKRSERRETRALLDFYAGVS